MNHAKLMNRLTCVIGFQVVRIRKTRVGLKHYQEVTFPTINPLLEVNKYLCLRIPRPCVIVPPQN